MNKPILNIVEFRALYKILLEIKDIFNFDIKNFATEKDFLPDVEIELVSIFFFKSDEIVSVFFLSLSITLLVRYLSS